MNRLGFQLGLRNRNTTMNKNKGTILRLILSIFLAFAVTYLGAQSKSKNAGKPTTSLEKQSERIATSERILLDSIRQLSIGLEILENQNARLKIAQRKALKQLIMLQQYSELRESIELGYPLPSGIKNMFNLNQNGSDSQLVIYFDVDENCTECLALFNPEKEEVRTLFPKLSQGIKSGRIILDSNYSITHAQVIRIPELSEFKAKYQAQQNNLQKTELAEKCLNRIEEINKTGYFDSNILEDYIEAEKKKIQDNNLDKKIQLRLGFINYLENKINHAKQKNSY